MDLRVAGHDAMSHGGADDRFGGNPVNGGIVHERG
jgi:hypothetical protein